MDRLADNLRNFGAGFFNLDYRIFQGVEKKLNEILEWAKMPKENRKPANLNWTSGTERNFGYFVEMLESQIVDKTEKSFGEKELELADDLDKSVSEIVTRRPCGKPISLGLGHKKISCDGKAVKNIRLL